MSTMVEQPEINTNAVKVKRAVFYKLGKQYVLKHYDTEILHVDIKTNKITMIKPVSPSSTRAIKQALAWLGIDANIKEECKRLNGVSQKEYSEQFFNSNYKYDMGN